MKALCAVVLVFAAGQVFAGSIEGRVIEVPDGVTVTVLSREGASIHRVRIAGIDVPKKAQEGAARASLRRLTVGKTVRVETNSIDAKGALIGTVEIVRTDKECAQPCAPTADPGLVQLANGLAVIDKANLASQGPAALERYLAAEAHARTHRFGVWREPDFQQVRADSRRR